MILGFDYEERIESCLSDLVNKGHTRFILYPFGLRGKMIKGILNAKFGISEEMIVDNKLCEEYECVYPLSELMGKDLSQTLILITSDFPDIHEELLERLYDIVPRDLCVDIFSDFAKRQGEADNAEKERIYQVTKKGGRAGMTYHPRNTNSKFFLPYVFMDYIQQSIFLSDDYYERRRLDSVFCEFKGGIIKDIVSRKDSIVIDAGANIGNHTLFFCNEMHANNVISFEPVIEIYRILEDNIKLNHLEDRVTARNEGLSDRDCNARILGMDYSNIGGSTIHMYEEGEIKVLRLDELGLSNVAFMKIDVEGMEIKVLRGAYETIKREKPYIMIESFDDKFPETKELLEKIGYKFVTLCQGSDYLFYCEDAE